MKQHTSYQRRTKRTSSRRQTRSQAKTRRRLPLRLSVPATWEQVENKAAGRRPRSHAVSWRTRLEGIFTKLFTSPRWVSLILLALLGGVFYFVGVEKAYYITDIEINGAVVLPPEALIAASGIDGQHIFWVDPQTAARRLVGMSNVLTASVQIEWPNRAFITISEQAPVLVWDQVGDRFWVDINGQLMRARQELPDLMIIFSQEVEKRKVGETIPKEVLAGALQLRQERSNIEALYYEPNNGLSYQDGRNWRAYFGVGIDMVQRLAIYEALVAELQARDLQPKYISVINKDKPFYRLVEPVE